MLVSHDDGSSGFLCVEDVWLVSRMWAQGAGWLFVFSLCGVWRVGGCVLGVLLLKMWLLCGCCAVPIAMSVST